MKKIFVHIAPEMFDADRHELPIAGELLLAGAEVTIDETGTVYPCQTDTTPDGLVIEVCRKGDVVEVAAYGEMQIDGGMYFSQICVLETH